jgi:hypothetical protein
MWSSLAQMVANLICFPDLPLEYGFYIEAMKTKQFHMTESEELSNFRYGPPTTAAHSRRAGSAPQPSSGAQKRH